MRRQRKNYQTDDIDAHQSASMYMSLNKEANDEKDLLQMERLTRSATLGNGQLHRFENTIEAKVEAGDTLQALALRFHCSVADIRRLNKIDKDNEIYARKVIKIPLTPHSVLLETLPIVHTSGSSSPTQGEQDNLKTTIMRNPLEDAKFVLGEKLIVASVNSSSSRKKSVGDINDVLNSKTTSKENVYSDGETINSNSNDSTALLDDILNDDFAETHMRPIRGPSLSALHWSGSDGDMTWVCLFVVILALCFAIPLIIVIFWTHPHSSNHNNTTATSH